MGTQSSKRSSRVPFAKRDYSNFAAITVVFNPIRYRSRYELYRKFSKHMLRSGINLFTIECIFESAEKFGLPKQRFEITHLNDPRHLQIKVPSVIWLKENLINIAVKRLPPSIEYVAWLDADIEFQRFDWPQLTMDQLQCYPIVQLFQLSFFLGPSGKKEILRHDYSFAYAIRNGLPTSSRRSSESYFHPGYAWAMRRETFDKIGGLLDFSILGSGDLHFAYALINRIDETIPAEIHSDYRRLANIWGERVARVACNGTCVGYISNSIYHHWHGSRRDRRYDERWSLLERFQFSPLNDLEKNSHTELLRLAGYDDPDQSKSAERLQLLETNIVNYFRLRDEDNMESPIPTLNTITLANAPTSPSTETFRPIDDASIHNEISAIEDNNYASDDLSLRNHLSEYQSNDNFSREAVL
ncbi:unnamed protein product [Rotaria socialis]|uniref:Uncharacterized protein n=1 Tax=Rotaria socialis TaxID=392032 RepID=A0A820U2V4_9BILA|nr:unnamed protein product [Rotaria socialis]CAF3317094.1 unnamed protein product [Rotaria socialis]CAF3327964.1 unnamed protein product [Rotaria socialis]CAF3378717.1 unnamed protein product [Rotaria socialis]CAF4379058.1 unnamed protein product [Rotaria socialis]